MMGLRPFFRFYGGSAGFSVWHPRQPPPCPKFAAAETLASKVCSKFDRPRNLTAL